MKVLKKTADAYGTVSEEIPEEVLEELTEKILEEKLPEEKILEEVKEVWGRKKFDREKDAEEVLKLWKPKTKLGIEVKEGRIKDIDDILDTNKKILEPEIVDTLLKLKVDLLAIGQSKGKFGGGKRRAWRQTQRKTKEGNVPTFSSLAVVGDEKGHVGIGYGRAKETLPARDKAVRKAKINLIKVIRTCSSFDCNCTEKHTVPCKIEGKGGSCRVILIPAPQGTGLVAANELKKVLKMAGIKDVYTKTFGSQRTTFNLVKACMDALIKTNVQKKK
ncbi:30S ribosomal protein S5 [Candidatus Pacearchaeota archaeon]|nr:30S ribosomal protein S5 [Candidatus Pacearchaeota archaeon]